MKPSAYIINTSRGPIIDEAALLGRIGGEAVIVFDGEGFEVLRIFEGQHYVGLRVDAGFQPRRRRCRIE